MDTKIIRRKTAGTIEGGEQIHPVLARIYSARGVQSISDLDRNLDQLISYQSLGSIDSAVELLVDSLEKQEHIIVIGDFDSDGATSTALAVQALRLCGLHRVSYLIPNRFEFGYGLTPEIVDVAFERKPNLIITVDNGVASLAGVDRAKTLGIKVLITDHHLQGEELPKADALVNPNINGDDFPSKNLAGVGVIFYVMLALRARLRKLDWFTSCEIPEPNMAELLDLVALGTVADVVPLDKNNRILVQQGLSRIKAGRVRPGIKALLEVAGRSTAKVSSSDLAFFVGPRLNAAGRLDDMSKGVECLLASNEEDALVLAKELDRLNVERRSIEKSMRDQAREAVQSLHLDKQLPYGLCLYDETWHQGVIGIVASRIKDQIFRPVIAFAKVDEQEIKGSARSVDGVHIRDVLVEIDARNPGLILKFGGHSMAAGLSLLKENYTKFSHAFDEVIRHFLSEDQLKGKIYSDGDLHSDEINLTLAQLLNEAGPWGSGFPEPLFDNVFKVVNQRLLKEKHLKLMLEVEGLGFIDAIAFNVDTKIWPNYRCEKIHAAYKLDINEWQGRRSVQLIIDHLTPLND